MADVISEVNRTEIIEKRSERAKIFDLGGGKRLLQAHCKPIHYEDGLAGWQDIRCDLMDATGRLETDRNRVKTSIRHDQFAGNVLGFEDRQNRLIRFTPLRVDVNGLKLADLGPTKQFRSIHQKSLHEVLDVINDDLSIEHYINEMGGKMWFVLPQMPKSFNITIQVDLSGDLICLNQLGKDGFYIKDKYGRFNFGSPLERKPVFWIKPPFWQSGDESFQSVDHSLANVGGTLVYSKFSTVEFQADSGKVVGPIRIDVNTYYAAAGDGYIKDSADGNWDTVHDSATGDNAYSTSNPVSGAISVFTDWGYPYIIYRSFFPFDTSDLGAGATITATDLKIYGYNHDDTSVSVQQGTQGASLEVGDFDAFSGSEFGHVAWAASAYNAISFNSAGLSAINKTGVTYLCCREYTYDYADVDPGKNGWYEYYNGCYFSEETGTTKDPKLEVTYLITVTLEVDIDSYIQNVVTNSLSIDSYTKSLDNLVVIDADSFLLRISQDEVTIDSLLKALRLSYVSIDSLLKLTKYTNVSIDSVIKSLSYNIISLDSVIKLLSTKDVSLDSMLKLLSTKDVSIDSIVQLLATKDVFLDSIVQLLATKDVSLDSMLKLLSTKDVSLDSVIQLLEYKSVSINAILKSVGLTSGLLVDSLLKDFLTYDLSIDAFFQYTNNLLTTSLDSTLVYTFGNALVSLDSLLVIAGFPILSFDARVVNNFIKQQNLDAMFKSENNFNTLSLDSRFVNIFGQDIDFDSILISNGIYRRYKYVSSTRNEIESESRNRKTIYSLNRYKK